MRAFPSLEDSPFKRGTKRGAPQDVDNIGPGVNFGDYIKTVLPKCSVALILIGPNWLGARNEAGARRLEDPHDWVRIEIETALAARNMLLVPVLVNGAQMPGKEELPESLWPLLRRNAATIRRDPDFHDDVRRLADGLRTSVKTGVFDLAAAKETRLKAPRRPATLALGIGIVAAALLFAVFRFGAAEKAPSAAVEPSAEVRLNDVEEPTNVSAPLAAPVAQSGRVRLNEAAPQADLPAPLARARAWDANCYAMPRSAPIIAACSNYAAGGAAGREWDQRLGYCGSNTCGGKARFVNADQERRCFLIANAGFPVMDPFCLAPGEDRILSVPVRSEFCVGPTETFAEPCTGDRATWVMIKEGT